MISRRTLWRGRFVPPWEREGRTAEDFFKGIMQSKNPIQKQRRSESSESIQQEPPIMDEGVKPETIRANEQKAEEHRRQFLPYGSSPKQYFSLNQMAAWGEYHTDLQAASSPSDPDGDDAGYSKEVMDLLKQEITDKIPYRHESCPAEPGWPCHGYAGVVLDIDGVVYRSKRIIPGSDSAIKVLQKLRIPFVFMTNGGGKTEAAKAHELSCLLQCDIAPDQVIMSHTPMKLLAPLYKHSTVLIGGHREGEEVAKSYGFMRPISIERFQCEHPELVPFKNWTGLQKKQSVPMPSVAAILTFSDLLDVMSDVQIVLDILLSPFGRIGTCVSGAQTVPYYHCADDLIWATEAPLPRLGGGAIREMLTSVFQSVSGENLQVTMYGKPRAIAYAYAEEVLRNQSEKLGWDPAKLRQIFMVGDNIESDILGANAAGGLWTSVHVLSGIGRAPAASRTLIDGDTEQVWLERCISRTPHYVAPTLDHFVRELLAYPEEVMKSVRTPYFGEPNPVDLRETYNFHGQLHWP